jgi:hypothetical protein
MTAITLPPLFDGMAIHSTCRDCGEIMTVTDAAVHTHPCCTETQTRLETLVLGMVSCVMSGDDEAAECTQKEIDAIMEVPNLADAAMTYASWGWPVFPLATCTKVPAVPKSIGGQGFKDAKTDVDRIGRWWQKHGDHNIGLATGHRFDVVDIDPKHGGVQSFLKLLHDHDLPECHACVVTASGGMHLYVKPTGKGNYASLRPGIDYRGKGGYVVAPPSTLGAPGRAYSWLTDPSPVIKK